MPASIFIVDDENGIRESLGALLRDEGYEVEAVASGEECLARLETRTFDLVLLDVWLKRIDGLETLERMQAQDGAPMVVMISGHASIETAVRATKLGAFDFVEKPLSLEKVVLVVRNALEYMRLETENRRLRAELEEKHQILGGSVPMKALRAISSSSFLFVAAITRTSTVAGWFDPNGSTRRSSSTRSTFDCVFKLMSPTSSKNSVPPSAF